MTPLLLAAAAPQQLLTAGREEREAVDDRAASSTASRPALSAWACGLDSADRSATVDCRDINPELFVELL
jgi:hypothetical protein